MTFRNGVQCVHALMSMLALLGFLVFGLMLPPLTAAAQVADSSLWSPPPKPDQCEAVAADITLVDVSWSMRTLFPSVRRELEAYIDQVENCQLVILATFGTTADVVAVEFVIGPESRQRLKEKTRELRPSQSNTNFDEAGKLTEWVFNKVAAAYAPTEVGFSVKVLSDDVPSPSPGKKPFGLREYLENSFPKARLQVIEVAARSATVGGAGVTVRSGEGVVIAQLPIEKLRAVLGEPGQPAKPATAAPPRPNAPEKTNHRTTSWFATHRAAIAVSGLLAVLMALGTVRLVQRKFKAPATAGKPVRPTPVTHRAPTSLLVRELEYRKAAPGRGPAVHLLREQRIPIGPEVPVTFGRDPMATWVVASDTVGNHGELFRITCVAGLALRIRGVRELYANGQQLSGAEREFDTSQPVEIRFGSVEWRITPEFGSDRNRTADELFAVAAAPDGPEA